MTLSPESNKVSFLLFPKVTSFAWSQGTFSQDYVFWKYLWICCLWVLLKFFSFLDILRQAFLYKVYIPLFGYSFTLSFQEKFSELLLHFVTSILKNKTNIGALFSHRPLSSLTKFTAIPSSIPPASQPCPTQKCFQNISELMIFLKCKTPIKSLLSLVQCNGFPLFCEPFRWRVATTALYHHSMETELQDFPTPCLWALSQVCLPSWLILTPSLQFSSFHHLPFS